MPDLFTPEQMSQLGVMAAIMSGDEAKRRIAEIFAAASELDSKRKAFEEEQKKAWADLDEAQRLRGEAEALKSEIAGREAEISGAHASLTERQALLNQQIAEWDEVRGVIAGQQEERAKNLDEREAAIKVREEAMAVREPALAEREKVAEATIADYDEKHTRLHAALRENAPVRRSR